MCYHWAENFSVNVIELLAMFYIMDTLRFVTNDEIIYKVSKQNVGKIKPYQNCVITFTWKLETSGYFIRNKYFFMTTSLWGMTYLWTHYINVRKDFPLKFGDFVRLILEILR